MATTKADLGDILLRQYSTEGIAEQQHYVSPMFSSLPVSPDVIAGDSFRFAVETSGDETGGFQTEGQAIASPNNLANQQPVLNAKPYISQVQMTGLAEAISGSPYAFATYLDRAISQKIRSMTTYLEGALFRDGTGQLALVNEPSSVPDTTSGNLNVDTPGTTHLRVGQNVEFLDSSTNVTEASAKITDVDHTNKAITLDANIASSIGDNSKIFKAGLQTSGSVATRELLGLDHQIQTSGTWHTLSLSTYPLLKGNVISASSADLSESLLQRAVDQIEIRMGLNPSNAENFGVWSHPFQRRKYLELVRSQKQFMDLNLDAGYKALTFNGMRWLTSNQAAPDQVYVGDWSKFEIFYTPYGPLQVDSQRSGGVIKQLSGFDALVVILRTYLEAAVRCPAAFCRIDGLSEPSF